MPHKKGILKLHKKTYAMYACGVQRVHCNFFYRYRLFTTSLYIVFYVITGPRLVDKYRLFLQNDVFEEEGKIYWANYHSRGHDFSRFHIAVLGAN